MDFKKTLLNTLPYIVYVGERFACQPAYLDDTKGTIEYNMSNELPKPLPESPVPVVYFESFGTFQDWVMEINRLFSKFQQNCDIIENAKCISDVMFSNFPFSDIPKFNNDDIGIEYIGVKSKSVTFSLKTLVNEHQQIHRKQIDRLRKILRANEFMIANESFFDGNILETISKRIELFSKDHYCNTYKPCLDKHYCQNKSRYSFDNIVSVLSLSTISNVSFLAAQKFLYGIKQKDNMRKRWTK